MPQLLQPPKDKASQAPAKPYNGAGFNNGYEFTQGAAYDLPRYPFTPPPEIATPAKAPTRYPVVIVGGGITGLTLACALARLGVAAVLLDEDDTVGVKGASSRGICYTQKSLEIFHKLGIYERIAAKGIQWSVGRTFAGVDEVYSFDLREQGNFNLSQQPPFINIQQFYIEGFLVDRIQDLGHIDIRWKTRVTGFTQNDQGAVLSLQTPAGNYALVADHVIDATGTHSPFHHWTGATVHTKKGDDRWCIADVRFSKHPPVERHTWIEAPFNENRAVWQHLMADNVWRIDYQMAPDANPAEVSRESVVRERLQRQFGPEVEVEIVWVGPYAYRSQCVDQLRLGRVFFVGDAVKTVSPFGARGGNTGISDADNLACKLHAVLRRQAHPSLLDAYHQERHEAATQNVQVTNRTARFLRAAEGPERLFRSAAISLAKRYPFARALINTGRMAVANQYTQSAICHPTGGVSVQNVVLWFDRKGRHISNLNDLLVWCQGRILLLIFGRIPLMDVPRLQKLTLRLPVRIVQVLAIDKSAGAEPVAIEHVYDPQGHLRQAAHAQSLQWVLIRPDAYLAGGGCSGPKWQSQLTAMLLKAAGGQA